MTYIFLEEPKYFGSLVLGGYDQSRFKPNSVNFSFDPDEARVISLTIQSIVGQNTLNGTTVSLLEKPTYVQVDFTTPHIWLPLSACRQFETAFGLQYDETTNLYRMKESTREALLARNAYVTISLGTSDPAERVNIVLPYGAFDHSASYPIYPNDTRFFPLRRAANDTQYTLGRVFMQEAYIVVDYERSKFSVHQAVFPPTTVNQQIVPILEPQAGNIAWSNGNEGHTMKKPLVVMVASISTGVFTLMLICGFVSWFYFVRNRRGNQQEQAQEAVECSDDMSPVEKDSKPIGELIHIQPISEVAGTPHCELAGTEILELPHSKASDIQRVQASTKGNY